MLASNPINVRRVDHVVLRTTQLATMIAFYRDVLGCRLERGPGSYGLAQLRAGASLIDLLEVSAEPNNGAGGTQNMDHVCLLVNPWDERSIRAHLDHHGVATSELATRYGAEGMGPSLYIDDPDGNVVELKGGVIK